MNFKLTDLFDIGRPASRKMSGRAVVNVYKLCMHYLQPFATAHPS